MGDVLAPSITETVSFSCTGVCTSFVSLDLLILLLVVVVAFKETVSLATNDESTSRSADDKARLGNVLSTVDLTGRGAITWLSFEKGWNAPLTLCFESENSLAFEGRECT